jgi:hypothetical protein
LFVIPQRSGGIRFCSFSLVILSRVWRTRATNAVEEPVLSLSKEPAVAFCCHSRRESASAFARHSGVARISVFAFDLFVIPQRSRGICFCSFLFVILSGAKNPAFAFASR